MMTFSCIGCKWVRHLDEINDLGLSDEHLIVLKEDIRIFMEDVEIPRENLVVCTYFPMIEFTGEKNGFCSPWEKK